MRRSVATNRSLCPVARKRTDQILVVKIGKDAQRRAPDDLVVEEPMSIQLDGHLVATTMRTPGHDYELAVGFCHADGLLAGHQYSPCVTALTGRPLRASSTS